MSSADNLVAGDTNAARDVFVRRSDTAGTNRVSVDSTGREASDSSFNAALSADGRWVVFDSLAANIAEPDANGAAATDVFIADRGADCDVAEANNRFVLPDNQWVTLSLPCEPPPGTTVADLFADDIDGTYGFSGDWAVYTLDTSAAVPLYTNPGMGGALSVGRGFWIIQRTGASVTLDLPAGSRGIASNHDRGSACVGTLGCVNTALTGAPQPAPVNGREKPRWSLLGNPFNTPVAHDDLRVVTDTGACMVDGCTLDEAFALDDAVRVVWNRLFHFDGSRYQTLTAGSSIEPWQGFWFAELAGAEANGPVLTLGERR